MTERDERIAELTKRLTKGFDAIGEATAKGTQVTNWETEWCKLLRQYETLEDENAAHHAEAAQVAMALDVPVQRKEVLV